MNFVVCAWTSSHHREHLPSYIFGCVVLLRPLLSSTVVGLVGVFRLYTRAEGRDVLRGVVKQTGVFMGHSSAVCELQAMMGVEVAFVSWRQKNPGCSECSAFDAVLRERAMLQNRHAFPIPTARLSVAL